MPNRLAGESSPYLRQHAGNPVDWRPWGERALSLARSQDRLIFLSIGYAACHWCHVMEHESFEDEQVAELLNTHFVPVKVDREERPDLDEIYMLATMLYSRGHGGWPMSVFLSPDLRPVYAGTYFPKDDAYGRPGFKTVLRYLAQRWTSQPAELLASADEVSAAIRRINRVRPDESFPGADLVPRAAEAVWRAFDREDGGIASGTNKFPQSLGLELLLRAHCSTGRVRYREAVDLTLERICLGGIYDHLGGGLHRYSTDPKWLVPHFEKMLYDQALVASVLLDAWQCSEDAARKELFARRVRGICDYVLSDLRSPQGAFYSSEDADSEGKEGKFYIWTKEQVERVLGSSSARLVCSHYGVTGDGNWMHPGDAHVPFGPKNVLHVARSAEVLAKLGGDGRDEIAARLDEARRQLRKVRGARPRPALDDKILTGWNGLMIKSLAKAAAVLREPAYGRAAAEAARFVLEELLQEGRLRATFGNGRARLRAYSTDYAFLIDGLLAVYEWSGDARFLFDATRLTDVLVRHYWDRDEGGFYLTASDHEQLLVRSKAVQDGATPSANSVMAIALQKLAVLLGRADFRDKAGAILRLYADSSLRTVFQQEALLCALDAWHAGWTEVAVVGPSGDSQTEALLAAVRAAYRPNLVLARSDGADPGRDGRIPLLAGRGLVAGRPAAYVCRDYVCDRPVTDPAELLRD